MESKKATKHRNVLEKAVMVTKAGYQDYDWGVVIEVCGEDYTIAMQGNLDETVVLKRKDFRLLRTD